MDRLHIAVTVPGIVLFLWFAAPLAAGIVNIGNITGMSVSALFACYGVFYRGVHRVLVHVWQSGSKKYLLVAAALLAVGIFAAAVTETVCIVRSALHKPPQNTTAVVLGCKVNGTSPSRILTERLDAAYDYLVCNPEAVCVLSGGQGAGEDISEAECMYRYLTGKGIDSERLLLEERSTTTEENLRYSSELLEERGESGAITIVTSEFHEYRANQVAKRLGMESYSTPSATFFIYLPTYYVRELYGILYYML